MPRAKCLFRRTDSTRAVRAVELATGKPVARVEIDKRENNCVPQS